jgi:hypothetical protein
MVKLFLFLSVLFLSFEFGKSQPSQIATGLPQVGILPFKISGLEVENEIPGKKLAILLKNILADSRYLKCLFLKSALKEGNLQELSQQAQCEFLLLGKLTLEHAESILYCSGYNSQTSSFIFGTRLCGRVENIETMIKNLAFWIEEKLTNYLHPQKYLPNLLSSKKWEGEGKIKVLHIWLDNLFPAQAKFYSTHPVGKIVLRNSTWKRAEVKLSFLIPSLSERSWHQVIKIKKRGIAVVPLFGFLNQNVFRVKKDTPFKTQIFLEYTLDGRHYQNRFSPSFLLHSSQAIDWSQPEMLVAFVNPRARVIQEFSQLVLLKLKPDFLPPALAKIENAIKVFSTLSAYGFEKLKEGETWKIIEDIQTPSHTLIFRQGTTLAFILLLSALLEALDIETQIIISSFPPFLIFNSAIPSDKVMGVKKELFLEYQNSLWVPLVSFSEERNFYSAWEKARQIYHQEYNQGKIKALAVRELHSMYPPPEFNSPQRVKFQFPPQAKERRKENINALKNKIIVITPKEVSPQR